MRAFLLGLSGGALSRSYYLTEFLGEGEHMNDTIDASPARLGGWLVIDNVDKRILGRSTVSLEGQQLWEALSVLVALRLWAPYWNRKRVRLRVRGDNVSSLMMVVKMKSAGEGTGLIAREMALDIAETVHPISRGKPSRHFE